MKWTKKNTETYLPSAKSISLFFYFQYTYILRATLCPFHLCSMTHIDCFFSEILSVFFFRFAMLDFPFEGPTASIASPFMLEFFRTTLPEIVVIDECVISNIIHLVSLQFCFHLI